MTVAGRKAIQEMPVEVVGKETLMAQLTSTSTAVVLLGLVVGWAAAGPVSIVAHRGASRDAPPFLFTP